MAGNLYNDVGRVAGALTGDDRSLTSREGPGRGLEPPRLDRHRRSAYRASASTERAISRLGRLTLPADADSRVSPRPSAGPDISRTICAGRRSVLLAKARHIEIDGKEYPYVDAVLVWSALATMCGLPATVAPIGHSANGLPIGVQIIGPYLEDRTTIAFAELLEREFGGFVMPPAFVG